MASSCADDAYEMESGCESAQKKSNGLAVIVFMPLARGASLSPEPTSAKRYRKRNVGFAETAADRNGRNLGYTQRSMVEKTMYRY